jgi:hypothetical protein
MAQNSKGVEQDWLNWYDTGADRQKAQAAAVSAFQDTEAEDVAMEDSD